MSGICIIGAGPAGSLAGILLARRGTPVTIVEQHRFPRHKVCGECLSAMAIDVLEKADVIDDVRGAGAVEIAQVCLHDRGGRSVSFALPRPMMGLSRFALDAVLLNQARSAGASVLQPARCEGIDAAAGAVVVRDLITNRTESLAPGVILLADGRRALLDSPPATGDFGVKAHFTGINLPRRTIHLFGFDGHYGGLAPVENGVWNLAASVPASRIRACPNLDELIGRMMDEAPAFGAAMRGAQRLTPILSCALPRFGLGRRGRGNAIPIGNAACSIEPIGGEGMGLAMASAAMAAEIIGDAIEENRAVPIALIRRRFRRLWLTRRPACRAAAIAFSHREIDSIAVRVLSSAVSFRELMLKLMGKAAGERGMTQM